MKNKILKLIVQCVLIGIVIFVVIFGVAYQQRHRIEEKPKAVVMVGFSEKEGDGLQKELTEAFNRDRYLKKGEALLEKGKIEEAIKQFEIAFEVAKSPGGRGLAIFYLANAYEKKRDYKKALEYVITGRDKYCASWAKAPDIERAKYLEYALNGEYDLAVEYARKALEVDSKLPNTPKGGRPDYIERLNDIIAAKDYIEGLKKAK